MRTRRTMAAAAVAVTVVGSALSGAYAASAAPGGDSAISTVRVSGTSPFAPDCGDAANPGTDTLYRDAEVQPTVAVNPRNPQHLVASYQQDRWNFIAAQGVLTATSFDGGHSWTRSSTPTASVCGGGNPANGGDFPRTTDSRVAISPDGTAYLMTLSMTGNLLTPQDEAALLVFRSPDGGRTWGTPVTLTRETGDMGFNDLPALTADPRDPRILYAAWTRFAFVGSDGSFEGPTYVSRSTDGGRTWETPRSIFDPGVNSYSYVDAILVRPDGGLVLTQATYVPDPATGAERGTAMVLRSADRGRTWSAPTVVSDLRTVGTTDPENGTGVRNGAQFVHGAIDGRGTLHLAWQDGRFSGGARDGIALSRSTDGGSTWSAPVAVNADPSVQAFMPAVTATRDGRVAVTYYDFGPNTADPATLPTRFRVATSADGLGGWRQRSVGRVFDYARAPVSGRPVGSLYLGDKHGLVAAGSTVVSVFPVTTDDPANRADIRSAVIPLR